MPKKHKSGGSKAGRSSEIKSDRKGKRRDADFEGDEGSFDAFALNRDRIAVDLDEHARSRLKDAEALGMGDEVLPLNLRTDSDEEVLEEDDLEEEGEDSTMEEASSGQRVHPDHQPIRVAKPGRFARQDHAYEAASPEPVARRMESADIRGAYHVGRNEDLEPDSEDEEAVALNLAETRRLQRAAREALTVDDFGIPEAEAQAAPAPDEELLPPSSAKVAAPAFASRDHAIAHLLNNSPEILSLVDDFASSSARLAAAAADLRSKEATLPAGHGVVALANLYHHTLLVYLGTLAFYFRVLSGTANAGLQQKVLARLTGLRQAVASLDEQGVGDPEAVATTLFAPNGEEEEEEFSGDEDELSILIDQLEEEGVDVEHLGDDQLADLIIQLQNAKRNQTNGNSSNGQADRGKGKKRAADDDVTDENEPPRKKKRSKKRKKMEQETQAPELPPLPDRMLPTLSTDFTDAADLLDPTSLNEIDAADKAKSKHDLRFHVRRAEQTAARRTAARTNRSLGGDDDVPYRSKERSRAAVQAREQAKENRTTGRASTSTALDDEDWGEADWGAAGAFDDSSEPMDADTDAQGYYDLVKSNKAHKLLQKKADYDADRLAERQELADGMEEGGVGGPRAVSRAILANKGLTPKRNKANRNPRVKKKLRYDKAKKKVASMGRTAYKGRPTDYEGEKSGISRRTVKSVKLGGT